MESVHQIMPAVNNPYAEREEFLRRAFLTICFNGIDGDYAEFGCASGTTFRLAYQAFRSACERYRPNVPYLQEDRRFWAFDSFSGLPAAEVPQDDHPFWTPGALSFSVDDFHQVCARHYIPRSAYEVVVGFYNETLAVDAAARRLPSEIALAYIDCDLYSSHMSVLRFLLPRLKHGMILALDDYYIWSSTQVSGARRAVVEVFSAHPDWRLVPYLQFGGHGMSYVVESKQILGDSFFTAPSSLA